MTNRVKRLKPDPFRPILKDGTIDIIATDHAPHTDYEKDKEFDFAPNGILGLETALPVTLDVLVRQNRFKLPFVVDLMTRRPARLLNLPAGTLSPGAEADICIFSPEEKWTYDAKTGFSKSSNSPWSGQTLTGRVKQTIVAGRVVFSEGRILAVSYQPPPQNRILTVTGRNRTNIAAQRVTNVGS
jgi:dihydroorotase